MKLPSAILLHDDHGLVFSLLIPQIQPVAYNQPSTAIGAVTLLAAASGVHFSDIITQRAGG
jgi:hypothetical protein